MDTIHNSNTDELYHYGRKGMKWYQNIFSKDKSGSSGKKSGDSDDSEGGNKAKPTSVSSAKKAVKDMSDEELNSAIKRLELEKRYVDLVKATTPKAEPKNTDQNQNKNNSEKKEKTLVDHGKEFVGDVLKQSGKNLAVQVINHYGAQALNEAIAKGNEKKVSKMSEQERKFYEGIPEVIFANNKKK